MSGRLTILLAAVGITSAAVAIACGSSADSSFADGKPSDGTTPGSGGVDGGTFGPGADAGGSISPTGVTAGSVVLVHASRNLPAFRVCFVGATNTLPLPDDKIMPNANVVGVDVGTAVHIGNLKDLNGTDTADAAVAPYDAGEAGAVSITGTLHVIEEKLTRQFYPQGTDPKTWPDCQELVTVLQQNGYEGHGLYTLSGDTVSPSQYSANFVVVKGCLPDPTLSTKQCGANFTAGKGNLSYQLLTVPAQDGMGFDFAGVSASPAVPDGTTLSYDLPKDSTTPLPIQSGSVSTSVSSALPATDADYNTASFELRGTGNTLLLQQTLATIQARSAPRDLPANFFGLRSTFVLFAIGDPTVADTTSPTALHFLAVPVQDPDMIDPEGGAL